MRNVLVAGIGSTSFGRHAETDIQALAAQAADAAIRDSGLSHLLAIAGLHLGLVGAFVFFTVRGGFTRPSRSTVRFSRPIRIIPTHCTYWESWRSRAARMKSPSS